MNMGSPFYGNARFVNSPDTGVEVSEMGMLNTILVGGPRLTFWVLGSMR